MTAAMLREAGEPVHPQRKEAAVVLGGGWLRIFRFQTAMG